MREKKESRKGTRKQVLITCLMAMSLFITTKVYAQIPYKPITDGCEWSVCDEKYVTMGDTLINGVAYMKVYSHRAIQPFEFDFSNAQYFTAIREDTVNKRVYCNMPTGTRIIRDNIETGRTVEPQDFLLYDYSLSMGDTVTFYTIYNDEGESTVVECIAVRTDYAYIPSVFTGGNNHDAVCSNSDSIVIMTDQTPLRRIFLECKSPFAVDEIWTESVGSIRGFNNGSFVNQDMPGKLLLCYTNADGAGMHTGFDLDENQEDCFNRDYMNGIPNRETKSFAIYPNPAKQSFTINFTEGQESVKQVWVIDMLGKVVLSRENPSCNTINIADLSLGIYAVRVLGQSGKEYATKLVKE